MRNLFLPLLGVLLMLNACNDDAGSSRESASLPVPDQGNGGITLPENFGAVVVVDTLGRGRHLAVNENGDIYVHLRRIVDGKAIFALRDTNQDARADIIDGFSSVRGTGIEIHNGFLYYSSTTEVFRAPLLAGQLLPDTNQTESVVTMVDGRGHMEKPFTFDDKGNMYVTIGSHSNACQETIRTAGSPGVDPCVELETRGGIWRFKANAKNQEQKPEKRYATGIRNAVAINWNPHTQSLFALQHGRDDLHRFWPDVFTEDQNVELPSEEFFEVNEGDDFGWPYCYFDHLQGKKFLNPEYGGDGKKTERCENAKMPLMGFPGHWGPNDLLFYTGDMFPERYHNGAFIAFHGSWNRLGHPQAGYKVVFVPFENGKPRGGYEVFADGFIGADAIENPGDAMYRPCGLAQGSDGSLYIVDSQKGRIWRIFYYPEGVPISKKPQSLVSRKTEAEEDLGPEYAAGLKVYESVCQDCHQANGMGVSSINPPLVGTEWVKGDKTRLINIVLNGFNEPIEVNGETFQNAMASQDSLSDQKIADVLTYVRARFGEGASPVTPEEVAALRK